MGRTMLRRGSTGGESSAGVGRVVVEGAGVFSWVVDVGMVYAKLRDVVARTMECIVDCLTEKRQRRNGHDFHGCINS